MTDQKMQLSPPSDHKWTLSVMHFATDRTTFLRIQNYDYALQ